jgi:hypothetical protein
MSNADETFAEYLRSLGVVTHFGFITGEESCKTACGRTNKVVSITNRADSVTCRQCKRVLSRWKMKPELANKFRFELELSLQ